MRQSVCDRLEISERRWPRLALTIRWASPILRAGTASSRGCRIRCSESLRACSGMRPPVWSDRGLVRWRRDRTRPVCRPQEVEAEHDEDDEQSGCGQPDVVYEDLHSLRILQQHSPAHHGRHHAYSQEAQGALAKNETGYGEGEPRRRESDKRPQPVLDEVRERIDEILQEWGRRTTPKQRITGTLVHQQLLREGHQVGSTTVRAYLAEQRRARQEVYLPLVWRAGGLLRGDRGGRWRAAEDVAVRTASDVLGAGLWVAVRTLQPGCLSGQPRARLQARLSVAYLTTP